ncbi:MAG: trypsin-like peptidase domain-containing protein [Oscillospiraceae bacterium]|nr:trypsin-like peptidase domain-containing protein [Oscillospiraceae bacterium]
MKIALPLKNHAKKLLSVLLLAALLGSLMVAPVSAANVSAAEAISTLETLDLVEGDGDGFSPERSATRAEAVVMLLRLLGLESAAESAALKSPFTDGGWADCYLAYAYQNGLVRGASATWFNSSGSITASEYLTMVLRALDYTEGTDFTFTGCVAFAEEIGLTHAEYSGSETLLREDLALISYTALTLKPKGSSRRLIEQLYLDGVVTADALASTRLASAVNTAKTAYTSSEIYELCSSATLYIEGYESADDLEAGKRSGRASAFLISADGVAIMTWHELEDCRYARATTTDGKTYDVASVLYYDPLRDVAVVRLSMTDTEGETVRRFPWLEVGSAEALSNGDEIHILASPLGLIDSISSGLVSNRSRVVDDPAYPCIQITAPASSGSSGGAVVNAYGEVVGILFASYANGQNVNLAVPIDCIDGVDLQAEGTPLTEIYDENMAAKATATLQAEETDFTIHIGDEIAVLVESNYPGQPVVQYAVEDREVVSCLWGSYETKQSVWLYITGLNIGESDVEICFSEDSGNTETVLTLHVRVLP